MYTGTVSVEGGFVSNSPVLLGEPVVFANVTLSNPPVIRYFWTFGDGGSSEDESPVHTYADPGVYTVTLFAANVHDLYQDTVQVLTVGSRTVYLPFVVRNYSP